MIGFVSALKEYLVLPSRISKFEHEYLRRMNRLATIIFVLHLPLFAAIAHFNETGPVLAAALTSAALAGPLFAGWFIQSPRTVSVVHGITMVLMCGLLIHFSQGPIQIEMHFYFFVGCTLLSVFGNPTVVLVALLGIAVHHVGLFYLLPESAWNYEPSLLVLMTHVLFAALAAASGVFNSRTFYNSIIQLEQKVEEHASKIGERNRDIGNILKSVEDGILTIDRAGRIHEERSASVDQLLGEILPGQTLEQAIRKHDEKFASWFAFGLIEVFDGVLPPEVAVDQLPNQLRANGRVLLLRYHPIVANESVASVQVIVSDITSEYEKQRLEAESREMLTLVDKYSSDPQGLLEFFRESGKLIEQLRSDSRDDLDLVKRQLHTLKGNASLFGLTRLSECCHQLEDQIFELNACPEDSEWTSLFGCWAGVRGNLRRMRVSEGDELRIGHEQYESLLCGLLQRKPAEMLAPQVATWRLDPTESRLRRVADQARTLAKRLGKGDLHVNVRPNSLGLEADHWSDFWSSLVHVVRNAVDHGVETIEERRLARKPAHGRITLATECERDSFVITVSDDGRGIDWRRIAESAEKLGLPTDTDQDLTDALFASGLSTASRVTAISGRGIGMSALRDSCDALNGRIEVQSRTGVGATFRFVFPKTEMTPRLSEQFNEHGFNVDPESMYVSTTSSTD